MAKSREGKDEEWLKGIIREQKAEIKRLKQKIKHLERQEYNFNNPKEKDEEPVERIKKCPDCGKGSLKEIELVGRYFEVCSICPHRIKIKVMKRRK